MSMRAAVGVVLLACATGCSAPPESRTPPAPPAAPGPAPVPVGGTAYAPESPIAADLPPLKANINNAARPPEVARAAYEFAARHPEVLKYVPCFCGCERGGHQGNEDCFVGARDKQGKVIEWETHGLVCEVCIDVATQAMQMHNSGASLAEIRAAIDKRYEAAPTHTPTPMPPARRAKGQ
jgi:hypothetical protein